MDTESFYSDVNHSYTETQIKTKTREHTIYVENPDFREKPRQTKNSTIRQKRYKHRMIEPDLVSETSVSAKCTKPQHVGIYHS